MLTTPSEGSALSFERDIRPLFRAKDCNAMRRAFDVFEYDDVVRHADAIATSQKRKNALRRTWPASQVDTFQRWIDSGKPA